MTSFSDYLDELWALTLMYPHSVNFRNAYVNSTNAMWAYLFALLLLPCSTLAAGPPAELSRFNPAGLSNEWSYEGTAFCALRTPQPGGTSVSVIRLNNPQKGYFLTTSEPEAKLAEKAGFVREGNAFYVPVNGKLSVHRFKDPADGAYVYSSTPLTGLIDEGLAFHTYEDSRQGSSRQTTHESDLIVDVARYRNASSGHYLFTASHESPYQVGAFYFGSFSPNAARIIQGTQQVHGRPNDWWGGVDDFYGQEPGIPRDDRGWDGDWSALKPAIGYYNQLSVKTLENQIKQASDAGLTFFSFYWYPSKKAAGGETLAEGLHSFLKAKNTMQLKFNLALYAHPWDDDMTIDPTNAHSEVERIVSYFREKNYLRLPDGRPVFVIGDFRNISETEGTKCADSRCNLKALENIVALLREVSLNSIGVAPFIQLQAGAPGWAEKVAGIDGTSCLVPPILIDSGTRYPALDESTFVPLGQPGRPVSACMLENFDERPRQDILIRDREAVRYMVGKTGDAFRHNLLAAKRYADQAYAETGNAVSRIIYLYAWNEWHEGGILEPNIDTGARDLNIVTDVFQLPRVPSACLDQNVCR
jgi:Glycosyltransferase WbsX/Repeat of unknown function (DUF5648)